MTAEPTVLTLVADGVMTITLNRPERGNGWNRALSAEYFAALDAAARSPEVRAVVVTGAGKAFCVGGDGEVLGEAAKAGGLAAPTRSFTFPLTIAKPVVAAINGACFGIGLQQALCCDVRFASAEAKFSTAYAKRGLVAEMGMSWLLPRLVGTGHAMDLLLSARLVRAAEAERMGLVNRVVPHAELLAEATAYARQLAAGCSPLAMRALKLQVVRDLESTLAEAYERSQALLDEASQGADFREGVASWQEQRPPRFPPLPEALALIDPPA